MEKYHLYHISNEVWQYFNTFGLKRKKTMSWDEKKDIAGVYHQNYVKKKRLRNKMDSFSKWVRSKYRYAVVKDKMEYAEKWDIAIINRRKMVLRS
jgi:hypothetical protein